MLLTGVLFLAIVVGVAGLTIDNLTRDSEGTDKGSPQGW